MTKRSLQPSPGPAVQVQLDAATQANLKSMAGSLVGIGATLEAFEKKFPILPVAVRIRLALPVVTKKGVIMANFELANDEVATIPILVDDAAGAAVPAPTGDTFTVVSSNPASLGATIGVVAGGTAPALVLTPLVQASPGLSVTVSDSSGLASFTQLVDILEDTTPKAITLDVAAATEASQPVPTATGP